MFRGFSKFNLDDKGRMVLPTRYRELLHRHKDHAVVVTIHPLDRCLLLYPLRAWEAVERKLAALSDADHNSRRARQMMRGHAVDYQLGSQGRVLIPEFLREYAGLRQGCLCSGQGDKLEIWNAQSWERKREEFLQQLENGGADAAEFLGALSL